MGYQDDIPQEDDTLAKSQEDLLNNFQAISTGFNVNHEGFNSEEKGMHKFLNMPEQEEAPSTGEKDGALYTKEVEEKLELFFREKEDGKEIQLTNASKAESTGNVILPGGVIFSWGSSLVVEGESADIYPNEISTILNIQFSVNSNVTEHFAWHGIGANGFKIVSNIGAEEININWLVIGK
ncbi:MAG: hypothetical protein E3J43_08585 [Candidatus Heimdallarchaeota archaeon]|nr:MAG: hypothetical protein E3J43_08585 [Candidatus Heimdallarchaeota archaeon]